MITAGWYRPPLMGPDIDYRLGAIGGPPSMGPDIDYRLGAIGGPPSMGPEIGSTRSIKGMLVRRMLLPCTHTHKQA